MIRQLISPPTYTIERAEQDSVYKPTIAMLMDCEVSPNSAVKLLKNTQNLLENYYTETDNKSFNIAQKLLSTGNLNILALNTNYYSSTIHRSTLSIYKHNNEYVSIYPSYTTIQNNVQTKLADQSISDSENTNYAYTIDISNGLNGKTHYFLIPYSTKTNLLVYMSRTLPMTDDGEVDKSEIPFSVNNYSKAIFINYMDFNNIENVIIDEVLNQMRNLGYLVDFDTVTRKLNITYRSLMKYPISDFPVYINDKNNYDNDYEGNRNKIIFNAISKHNSVLDNLFITITRYNLRYSITISNRHGLSVVDIENYSDTNLENLIEYINTNSKYVEFSLFSDFLPVGTFQLKCFEEYTAKDISNNIEQFLDKLKKTSLFNYRVDIFYNYHTDDNWIYEKITEIVDSCEKRCILISDYVDEIVPKCSCIFMPSTIIIDDFNYDLAFYMLYILGKSGGFEQRLEYDIIQNKSKVPDNTSVIINDIYDNVYYYSILNPLCLYNENKTTLDEGFGFITILNYTLQELSRMSQDIETLNDSQTVLDSCIYYINQVIDVLPSVEIYDFVKDEDNRQMAIYFETIFDNSIDLSYEVNINISIN